jgi:hypothetical protein
LTAARYGGEEFLLVLPDTTKDQAVQTINRLRAIVSEVDWATISEKMFLTMSAGVCSVRQHDSAEDILARADLALYRAKDVAVTASSQLNPATVTGKCAALAIRYTTAKHTHICQKILSTGRSDGLMRSMLCWSEAVKHKSMNGIFGKSPCDNANAGDHSRLNPAQW